MRSFVSKVSNDIGKPISPKGAIDDYALRRSSTSTTKIRQRRSSAVIRSSNFDFAGRHTIVEQVLEKPVLKSEAASRNAMDSVKSGQNTVAETLATSAAVVRASNKLKKLGDKLPDHLKGLEDDL